MLVGVYSLIYFINDTAAVMAQGMSKKRCHSAATTALLYGYPNRHGEEVHRADVVIQLNKFLY